MKYIKYITELFDFKNYKWVNSDISFQFKAEFIINNRKYYVCFDEIHNNGFNHYFYYLDDSGKQNYHLLNIKDGSETKILSNVKAISEDFIKNNNPYFLGFFAEEKERKVLYMMYAQWMKGLGNLNTIICKTNNNKEYYFIFNNLEVFDIILDRYI